jgi:hypothetical protein
LAAADACAPSPDGPIKAIPNVPIYNALWDALWQKFALVPTLMHTLSYMFEPQGKTLPML